MPSMTHQRMRPKSIRMCDLAVVCLIATACNGLGRAPETNRPGSAPRLASATAADAREVHRRLVELQDSGFSGAVVIANADGLLLSEGYGLANRGNGTPATPTTRFHLGSVTKMFTGAAILKLQEQGRLSVQDPVTRFLPNVPPDKQDITIHQLLTHTSGLPGDVVDCGTSAVDTRDEYAAKILAAPLGSTPGDVHEYSNAGYGLLGAIIELASGESYERYLTHHLFQPSGMESTGYTVDETDSPRIARGYRDGREYRGLLNAWAHGGPVWCLRASGGLLSSAEDMYRWHRALQDSTVLSPESKRALMMPHVPEQPERTSFYGYGLAIFTTVRGTRLIAHNGSVSSYFTSDYRWYPDENVFYFIASNSAEQTARDVSPAIPRIIFRAR
jgi:CubicO group peptidase (beta-lactamase class C family)